LWLFCKATHLKKEFIYNIFFLIAINLLIKPLYIFGIDATVQNRVANFGLYLSMFSFVNLFQVVNDAGLQSYNSIYISNNKSEINHYFPRILGLKILLLILFSICVFISAFAFKYDFNDFGMLTGLVLIFFLGTLYFMLRTSMSAFEHYRIDTWLSSLDRLFMIIVLGYLILIKFNLTLSLFVWIQVICYGICILIGMFFLNRLGVKTIPIIDIKFIKYHLEKSLPYAFIILSTSIVSKVDLFMLERMLADGISMADQYGAGVRFIDAGNMFGVLFGGLLLPMFSNKIVAGESIQEVFSVAFRLILLISLIIGFTFFFYASDIFGTLYKKELNNNLPAIKILLLTIIPILISNTFGPIILATKKIKPYNLAFAIAAIAIIILNYFLIPLYDLKASASIALFTWTSILIMMIYLCVQTGEIEMVNSGLLVKSIILSAIAFSCYLVFGYISLNWMIEIILCPSIVFILAIKTRYITFSDVLKGN
jgi:O-antigen/teichoic acid export membrane protein